MTLNSFLNKKAHYKFEWALICMSFLQSSNMQQKYELRVIVLNTAGFVGAADALELIYKSALCSITKELGENWRMSQIGP